MSAPPDLREGDSTRNEVAFVLASASPRRRELLEGLGLHFLIQPADIDETPGESEAAAAHVARLAGEKALAVVSSLPVLAADTVVVRDGEILGKPRDRAEAAAMIRSLSGRSHEVISGVALARAGELLASISVRTEVRFRALDERTVAAYVATGEGDDKAGSYGIQGLAGALVTGISGSYSNVVGLPLAETVALLEEHGVIGRWP